MNNKFSEKELLEIVDSGLSDLSCEEIKKLIKKESEKDYEHLNTDFIDLCFDVLAMKKQQETLVTNYPKTKIRSKKQAAKKILIIAAVFMMFIVTILTVSATVFHFNIPKEISSLIDGNAKTDINLEFADTTADGYSLENSDLAKKLRTQGIYPVTLPEELIKENSQIIKIDNITTDESISTDVEIEFNYNNAFGALSISQYTNDFEWTGEMVDENVLSADMIEVNGMDVLIFELESSCTINYKDGKTIYSIYLETDFETAKSFAKTIK